MELRPITTGGIVMDTVTWQFEITVRATGGSGVLGRLMATTASCGAEVLAAHSYWDGTSTVVRLVTQDAPRTMRALEGAGYRCKANPIVLVEAPNKPGLAAVLGGKLMAAGIKVFYSYSFRTEDNRSYIVFRTFDDERAVYMLQLDSLIHDLAAAK